MSKRSKIWDLLKLVELIWGNFELLTFKVILGSFGVLAIFPPPKRRFSKRYFFLLQLWFFISRTFSRCFPWQSTQKYWLEVWNIVNWIVCDPVVVFQVILGVIRCTCNFPENPTFKGRIFTPSTVMILSQPNVIHAPCDSLHNRKSVT